MKPFHRSVALWVVWSGMNLVDLQQATHLPKYRRLKICTLITLQYVRASENCEDSFHQRLGYHLCGLCGQGDGFRPLGEMVSTDQQVLVTRSRCRERTQNVHRYALERKGADDGFERRSHRFGRILPFLTDRTGRDPLPDVSHHPRPGEIVLRLVNSSLDSQVPRVSCVVELLKNIGLYFGRDGYGLADI
mgnify:CR=1 FL=1